MMLRLGSSQLWYTTTAMGTSTIAITSCTVSSIAQNAPKCAIGSHSERHDAANATMPTTKVTKHGMPASQSTQLKRVIRSCKTDAGCSVQACHESKKRASASRLKATVTGAAIRVSDSTW